MEYGQDLKTGFQAKFLDPIYRRLFLDRQLQALQDNNPQIITPDTSNDAGKDTQKLDDMVKMCEKPLLKVKTVFPFVLFTDEVIVDINKVSVIYRNFFFSKQIHSVLIKDVSDVVVETSLLFATLKIVDVGYTDNSIDINYLKRSDGTKARKVIQGLVMAQKHNVDLTKVDHGDLLGKLESLGTNSPLS